MRATAVFACLTATLWLAGCATRSVDVAPLAADPADFAAWDCPRIHDERDEVQRRAADVAWAVDERAGHNVVALGLGVSVFWPALLALRPAGPEAQDLARLKGRDEALSRAAAARGCAPSTPELSAVRAAALPLAVSERLVYEDRADLRQPGREWALRVVALRRGEFEYRIEDAAPGLAAGPWLQDRSGNVVAAPAGALTWPRLLRGDLALGQVVAGEMLLSGEPLVRGRLRGQVVAQGEQRVAGRRFDVAVVELFGDAQRGESSTRVTGALVVDRSSGVLLRLDLRSGDPAFQLQRRLMRVEPGPR